MTSTHVRRAILLGTLLSFAAPALGQEGDPATLEERLAAQEEELRRLKAEVEGLRDAPNQDEPEPVAKSEKTSTSTAEDEPPPATTEDEDEEKVELGLFYIRSSDGAHELNLHARIMLDARFDLAHDYFDQTFQVRRARFTLEGHVFEHVGFKLGLEFGRTASGNVRDAYIKLAFLKEVQLWGGQMLLPYSTSRLTSSNYMKHPERPILVSVISGRRDVGVQLYGNLFDDRLTYWFGIYNGTGQNVRQDTDDDFDYATRLEVRPVEGLQLAANYILTPTNRSAIGPLDARTVGNQASRFLDYDTANIRRLGKRHRVGGSARFRWGPLQVLAEVDADYLRKVIPPGTGQQKNLLAYSYFVDVSYVLTGEKNQDTIIPNAPFYQDGKLGPGAFDLALRFEDYRADSDAIRQGFATGSDKVKSGTVTLTWIPVERVRCMLSYTGSSFSRRVADQSGKLHKNDHVALLRMHLFF